MRLKRILILGGTGEARDLANRLVDLGCDVTTSLAGVTESPALPRGNIRRGGFGGVEGLVQHLTAHAYDQVIDATHPFAAQISKHAAEACLAAKANFLRVERQAWQPEAGDHWISARDFAAARDLLPHGARVMLTLGRKEVAGFFARGDLGGVARMIKAPAVEVPAAFKLVLQRPPFSFDSERELMRVQAVEFLLCKNSGSARAEKLDAARRLALPVIMVERPRKPAAETVHSVDEAVALLLGRRPRTG
jgi:precorrin-6A/cobalt-precorrin-6A reductase